MAQSTRASTPAGTGHPTAGGAVAHDDPADATRVASEGAGEVVAADLAKGRAEVVRVQLRTYQGRRYVDVRTYYWDECGPGEALRPTKKGVSLAADRLPELRGALDVLAAALDADR